MSNTILRLPDVLARTGLARSTVYQMASEGSFPQPINLSLRAVGWLESEVDDWVIARVEERRQGRSSSFSSLGEG